MRLQSGLTQLKLNSIKTSLSFFNIQELKAQRIAKRSLFE